MSILKRDLVWPPHPGIEAAAVLKRLCLAAGFIILCRLADFSYVQSLVLLLVFAFLYELISPWEISPWEEEARRKQKAESRFVPYWVSFMPNLRAILTDFDLLKDTEEAWSEMRMQAARITQDPDSFLDGEWNVWRSGGCSFSVVTPELIYVNRSNSFATKLDEQADLKPVAIPLEEKDTSRSDSPDLYLEGEPGSVYSLSIRVPSWWWNKVKEKEVLRRVLTLNDILLDDGHTAKVTLALIGSQVFEAHFLLERSTGIYGFPKSVIEKAVKSAEETCSRWGWKPSDDGLYIKHRYVSVWYERL